MSTERGRPLAIVAGGGVGGLAAALGLANRRLLYKDVRADVIYTLNSQAIR